MGRHRGKGRRSRWSGEAERRRRRKGGRDVDLRRRRFLRPPSNLFLRFLKLRCPSLMEGRYTLPSERRTEPRGSERSRRRASTRRSIATLSSKESKKRESTPCPPGRDCKSQKGRSPVGWWKDGEGGKERPSRRWGREEPMKGTSRRRGRFPSRRTQAPKFS